MKISSRVEAISESVTLKLNARTVQLSESGKKIFNLTAGQLPFRPLPEFCDLIRSELDFIKSYQYSPVAGYPELRKKVINHIETTRDINLSECSTEFDCIISNGGKHALSNIMNALIEPGNEVIILAPYWVSYPEMVTLCQGTPIIINSTIFDVFTPSVRAIKKAITPQTKAIIINSPNNPTGIHYSEEWMQEFAEMIVKFPHVNIISDEIYYELAYYDPKPTFFYQKIPDLLERTIIVEGISKTFASTGLRIGYTIAPKVLIQALTKLQGQTTSGASSLIQRALINFDFALTHNFLEPIRKHLRDNATTLMNSLRDANLPHCWYQPTSAFYFLLDFSQTPIIEKYKQNRDDNNDYSAVICEEILTECGVSIVPGHAFGVSNAARISIVLEREPFKQAIDSIINFATNRC